MYIIGIYETNIVSLESSRFTIQEHINLARSFVCLLNPHQKMIFDDVIDSIFNALYDGFKHFLLMVQVVLVKHSFLKHSFIICVHLVLLLFPLHGLEWQLP